jgi:hypothetical protein
MNEPQPRISRIVLPPSTSWPSARAAYGRVLAASRAADEGWSAWRRVAWSVMLPLGAPAARAACLLRSLRGRRSLWGQATSALPVSALLWLLAGIGQAVGCLFGLGDSKRRLKDWELGATRSVDDERRSPTHPRPVGRTS